MTGNSGSEGAASGFGTQRHPQESDERRDVPAAAVGPANRAADAADLERLIDCHPEEAQRVVQQPSTVFGEKDEIRDPGVPTEQRQT